MPRATTRSTACGRRPTATSEGPRRRPYCESRSSLNQFGSIIVSLPGGAIERGHDEEIRFVLRRPCVSSAAVATACGGSSTTSRDQSGTATADAPDRAARTTSGARGRRRGDHHHREHELRRTRHGAARGADHDQERRFGRAFGHVGRPPASSTSMSTASEQGTLTAPIRTRRVRVLLHLSPLDEGDTDRQVDAGENRSHADWRVMPNAAPMRAQETPRSRSS